MVSAKGKSEMDPNLLLGIGGAIVSGLFFLPKIMMAASDRIAAEKKAIEDRFTRLDYRIEAAERAMVDRYNLVESHQTAITHRMDLQEQKTGLTLDAILATIGGIDNQMRSMATKLDEIQHRFRDRSTDHH